MGTPVYSFGDFRLNSLTRELTRSGAPVALAASAFDCLVYLVEHRERPVGRDELISAVWGRADVSDNLLAQTIVRLRRALGDAGTEQRCIKTVARVGYRWMLDTTVASTASDTLPQNPLQADAAVAGDDVGMHGAHPRTPHVRRSLLVALLLTVVLAVSYLVWQGGPFRPAPAPMHFNQGTAIVLPAEVNAPDDWKWLHLGLMDLLSTRLRDAKVPTENSQDVLNLLSQSGGDAQLASFALVVTPHVVLSDSHWHVHLDAKSKDGRSWQAESSSGDVLAAARAASDLLLAQLGFEGPSGRQASGGSQEYLLRIEAAQLAGQPELARQLIESAPPNLRRTPELAFAQAELYCDEGKLDPCEQSLTELRKQVSAKEHPVLRGKVLTALWFPYRRKNQFAEGEAALDEAVHILQGQKDTEALANAYLDRSHLLFFGGKLDEATSDLGRARINFTLAGDSIGQARVDFAMGMMAQSRGQFAASLSLMQHAYEQYQRMGMRQLLSSALQGLAYSQKMLLQFPEELATTDRYWPFDQKHMDFLDDYVRHQLTLMRAMALADNGRTSDASTLLEHMRAELDPKEEADLRAGVDTLLAKLALERDDVQGALSWIDKAMTGPTLQEDDDPHDYGEAWFVNTVALQRVGKTDELRRNVAAMQAWAAHLPKQDDLISIWLMRAKAAQAWSEGQHDQALEQLKLAMAAADTMGVPDVIVDVGHSYALTLLAAGQVDQAVAVSGRLSDWTNTDWRAARVEASVLQALGQGASAQKARNKAQQLAGDRVLPASVMAVF
ncbi:winged helix-turn-helix domain-containing protein [Dyella humi]|uniref:Winged helix-turn-helix domain-containing protein n=1 Tax=Dyella humi TaxID=1770547 RepID=A0ABW8IE73_9GAMM